MIFAGNQSMRRLDCTSVDDIGSSGGSRISRGGGGHGPHGGAWTPEVVTFRKILYVKMKESGPLIRQWVVIIVCYMDKCIAALIADLPYVTHSH